MDGETWKVAIERAASLLADDNRVEDAWFLRGVADALAHVHPEYPPDADYRREYRHGYSSAYEATRG